MRVWVIRQEKTKERRHSTTPIHPLVTCTEGARTAECRHLARRDSGKAKRSRAGSGVDLPRVNMISPAPCNQSDVHARTISTGPTLESFIVQKVLIRALRPQVGTMIQLKVEYKQDVKVVCARIPADPLSQTMLNCIDNSGATLVECVANLRMKRHGRIGMALSGSSRIFSSLTTHKAIA